MLNEIGEYEQYTYSLTPQEIERHKDTRLKYLPLIKRDLSGLERAMTIVARHFMFDVLHCDSDSRLSDADFEELREILRAWCGFNSENAPRSPLPEDFKGWLVKYIQRTFLTEKVQTCREKLSCCGSDNLTNALSEQFEKILNQEDVKALKESLNELDYLKSSHNAELKEIGDEPGQIIEVLKTIIKLSEKNKYFSKSVFGAVGSQEKGNFRCITYDKIIANAFLAGKLRRYYLTCDEDLFGTKKIVKNIKNNKALSVPDMNMVLKITAEYLLKRRYTSQNYTEVNGLGIMNWLKGVRKPEQFNLDSYILADSKENIFESVTVNGIQAKKIRLHSQWIKHFQLVEDGNDATDEALGQIFFSDTGYSEHLCKNVRYAEM